MDVQDDAEFLTDRHLIPLAGEAAFGRGLDYYRQGMVTRWSRQGTTISADVVGSHPYRVQLRISQRGLDGSCNCPASEGIDFCKHCVAVAMAYRAEHAEQWQLAEGDGTDRALQSIDDSGGFRFHCKEALQTLHVKVVGQ